MHSLRAAARLAACCQKLNLTHHVSQRYIKRYVRPTLIELTKRKWAQGKQVPNPRSKFLDWNRDAEIYAFNNRLSEQFDTDLLEQAFIHRSYVIREEEDQKKVGIEDPQLDLTDNREMIDEGREIVSLVIDNYLSQSLPLAPQECIYAFKQYLLSTPVLANTASGIGAKDLILSADSPLEEETIANTFYALTSALNRSVDLEHTGLFVRDILIAQLVAKDLMEIWCPEEPVEILNDILDREHRELAEPRIIAQNGVNTLLPVYNIAVYSNQEFLGSGFGETIEEAEKMAAINALQRMFGLLDHSKPIRCNLKINETEPSNLPLEEWSRSNA
ncbi:39S ribosomal protein L44, mitochondrial [Nasonia vitripennis]|uniref:Large ribosomal subunit protein mL44 n=1 Tax=Nasonia vitripennis TaxID=7425 RepID=A0A7M7GCA4_NASVI|nr:39S ribosomal protein L44, mitochondrial [Nasonia vitripennis]